MEEHGPAVPAVALLRVRPGAAGRIVGGAYSERSASFGSMRAAR
jgi:hypothetical protein